MKHKHTIKYFSMALAAACILAMLALLAGCGMRTSEKDESVGLSFYLNAAKDGYYVQADNLKTEYNIPAEYKGKPVIGIIQEGFLWAKNYTALTVPSSLVYVGPSGLTYKEDVKYNEYQGGYYVGNSQNPYVILVYAYGEHVVVADTCKSICGEAISANVKSLTIPASVEYISPYAFDKAAGISNENGTVNTGLVSVTVDEQNAHYKSVGTKMVLNKSGTRLLCLIPDANLTIPATVEFVEAGAILYGYDHCISYNEDNSLYIPSENNPYFLLLYAGGSIRDGVKVIAGYACQNGQYVIPDSVVQLLPKAFYGNNVTATATSGGWFNADEYLDGMAYDFAVSGAKYDKDFKATTVYLKGGEYTKIIVDEPPFVNWNLQEFRRYTN